MAQDIILSILFIFYLAFFAVYFIMPMLGFAPFYPSNKKAVRDMLELAELKQSDKVIDLGSGDGRLVFKVAKFSKDVTGIELNPFFYLFSKFRELFSRNRKRVKFTHGNYLKVELAEYDVIFCYLFPKNMRELEKKFKKELRPGTRIITNTFHLENFKEEAKRNKIRLYVVS